MRTVLERGGISFAISSFAGTLINFIIDLIGNACGISGFISISPDFRCLFPTPVMAAYVNIFLYGLIGATFAVMTVIFECNRIGFLIQGLIYFLVTAIVSVGITILFWQLHHHPAALICTLLGYGATYVIMGFVQYRRLKQDVQYINEELA